MRVHSSALPELSASPRVAIKSPRLLIRRGPDTKPRKTSTWFALREDRPLFAFAGLWTAFVALRARRLRAITSCLVF